MNLTDGTLIKVYNRGTSAVGLTTNKQEYLFPAMKDGIPSMDTVSFAEIEYANSRGNAFKTGALTFDDDVSDEIYSKLRIKRETLWFNDDIENAVLNPTVETSKRILAITDIATINRVRSFMVQCVNERKSDVSNRIIEIINGRFNEILQGRIHSAIEVNDDVSSKNVSEVDELKAQIARMEKMIAEMSKKGNTEVTNTVTASPLPQETPTKRKTAAKRKTAKAEE